MSFAVETTRLASHQPLPADARSSPVRRILLQGTSKAEESAPHLWSRQAKQDHRNDVFFLSVAVLLTLCEALKIRGALLHTSPDITVFYLEWYKHIVQYGRWASMEGSYANYSPPYLYILGLTSLLNGKIASILLIKLAQLPGMIAAAALFWSICRRLGCSTRRSAIAAWTVLVAPDVFQNTIIWGQCDMLHTACLLAMLRLLLSKRPGWAMFAFGVAFAFKLQAIFVGAVIAALLLSGEVPLWAALCVPLGYIVMMVPAWLAGRPWKQLLLIYKDQYQTQPDIAKDVANPYQLIYHLTQVHDTFYAIVLRGGFLVTAATMLGLILFLVRRRFRLQGQRLIVAMAAALLLAPYLLPKMHDRYFFAGDVMVLLLAMMRPGLWIPATMLQISALWTAFPHLYRLGADESTLFYVIPVLLTTVAVVWILRLLLSLDQENDSNPPGSIWSQP